MGIKIITAEGRDITDKLSPSQLSVFYELSNMLQKDTFEIKVIREVANA